MYRYCFPGQYDCGMLQKCYIHITASLTTVFRLVKASNMRNYTAHFFTWTALVFQIKRQNNCATYNTPPYLYHNTISYMYINNDSSQYALPSMGYLSLSQPLQYHKQIHNAEFRTLYIQQHKIWAIKYSFLFFLKCSSVFHIVVRHVLSAGWIAHCTRTTTNCLSTICVFALLVSEKYCTVIQNYPLGAITVMMYNTSHAVKLDMFDRDLLIVSCVHC